MKVVNAIGIATELLSAALRIQQELARVNETIQKAQSEGRDLTDAEEASIRARRGNAMEAWRRSVT